MDERDVTNRLTGEEAPEDVPSEAVDRAQAAERRVREQHDSADPEDAPISES